MSKDSSKSVGSNPNPSVKSGIPSAVRSSIPSAIPSSLTSTITTGGTSGTAPLPLSPVNSGSNNGQEAIRILEGLISKPPPSAHRPASPSLTRASLREVNPNSNSALLTPYSMLRSPIAGGAGGSGIPLMKGIGSPSPRTLLQEKVRNSLSNLSSALELETDHPTTNNSSTNSTGGTGGAEEGDFAARLNKLRNMHNTFEK